jgi:hypothetical protein
MQKETLFKVKVRAHLDLIPCAFFFKTQMVSLRGIPDFIGVIRGRFVALELKVGRNKLDSLQGWVLKKIAAAGGVAREVRPENLEEVIAELRAIK